MTLDSQVDVPSTAPPMQRHAGRVLPAVFALRQHLWIFALFFVAVVALQLASGAYRSEFGSYPDEPAHYVTSLMLRDYLTHFDPLSPVKFARAYYHHYPKVAFGHWPPFFYIVQGVWMLLFSASRASVRLEIAFTTALLAYSIYLEARRWFDSRAAAVLAGLLTVCLPIVQTYTDEEMAETLLVLLCFWSVIHFARYLDSGRWQNSLCFGLFFSLAVLTKGNGWLLALVPPIALLLTRKLGILRQRSFWGSALLVAVLCVPWQLMTLESVERGWDDAGESPVHFVFRYLVQYLEILAGILGPVLFVIALVGVAVTVVGPALRGRVGSRPAVMGALLFSVWVFHSLVPAGVEDRKMIPAVPALILFLFAGGFWLARRVPVQGTLAKWRPALVAVPMAILFSTQTFAIPQSTHYGYIEAARFLTSDGRFDHARILVSSDSLGEGLLISEVAMREPHPSEVILRATKTLADVNWNATEYRCLFSTPAQVLNYLRNHHIDLVVLDTFPPEVEFSHDKLLREAVAQYPPAHVIATFSEPSGKVQIYALNSAAGSQH